MRSLTALWLTLIVSSTISCGDKAKPPEEVRPTRPVVVAPAEDPLCDVSRYPEPASAELGPRDIDAARDRVCVAGPDWRTTIEALRAWRARAEAFARCEAARAAAHAARSGT